ncbi:MAG: hypothetical protein QOD71_430 [Thermoleophilaceae bacterium]|jgi:hypothetical protein|nr:hypothetical protein [Thermoleophilaceae bacterium]
MSNSAPHNPSKSSSLRSQLQAGLERLGPDTVQLLQSLKEASPELRRLALQTSPFATRAELIAHGLLTRDESCEMTSLGNAALEVLQPLAPDARRELAAEAQRVLDEANREATAGETESESVAEAV